MSRSLSRRSVLRAAGAAAGAALSPLVPSRALAEGTFTVGCSGGSWGEGIKQAFIVQPEFEARAGTKAVFAIDSETQVSFAKAVAKCGDPPFSVVYLLPAEHSAAAAGGCLQDYDLDIVTNYRDIYPAAIAPPLGGLKDWSAPCGLGTVGLLWNTKECSRPASWQDMWNPKYKGRVGIPALKWIGLTWMHALNRSLGGTEDNIDPAIQALIDLRKNNDAVFVPNVDQAFKMIARGDIVLLPFWNGRTSELQDSGAPVELTYVPSSILFRMSFVLPKGSQFSKAANLFVQNTLDPELQLNITKRFRYPPSNRTAKLPAEMERYRIPESTLETAFAKLDWQVINQHRDEHYDRWNREVLG